MHPSHEPLPGAWSAPPGARPEPPASPDPSSDGRPETAAGPQPAPGGPPYPFPGDWAEPSPGPGGPGRWSPRHWRLQGPRRPWRRTLTVTVVVIAAISSLGVPFGLFWAWLAPGVPVIDVGDNGVVVNDPSPEQYIAADGWFTLLGVGFGLLVAIAAWLALRRDRGPFLLVAVVIGTSVAAQRVAPFVGEMIGRADYDQWRATAAQGATYLAPPEVHSFGPTLVPAFAAAIVLTLLAGWSNDPDLDQPGAQPGYGANHPGLSFGRDEDAYDPADYQRPAGYPEYGHGSAGQPGVPQGYGVPPGHGVPERPQDDGPVAIGGGDHLDTGAVGRPENGSPDPGKPS